MAPHDRNSIETDEASPLLPQKQPEASKYGKSVLYLTLLCSFLVSVSFGVTQVPYAPLFSQLNKSPLKSQLPMDWSHANQDKE